MNPGYNGDSTIVWC